MKRSQLPNFSRRSLILLLSCQEYPEGNFAKEIRKRLSLYMVIQSVNSKV